MTPRSFAPVCKDVIQEANLAGDVQEEINSTISQGNLNIYSDVSLQGSRPVVVSHVVIVCRAFGRPSCQPPLTLPHMKTPVHPSDLRDKRAS